MYSLIEAAGLQEHYTAPEEAKITPHNTNGILGAGYLAKMVVELHGGTIMVESGEGSGSLFTITLQNNVIIPLMYWFAMKML